MIRFITAFFLTMAFTLFAFADEVATLELNKRGDQLLSYNFGRVQNNTKTTIYYGLKNTGTSDLEIKAITIIGAHFFAQSECPQILKPGKKCLTSISYWPVIEGLHHGELTWETSDGQIHLSLWGESY